MTPQEEADRARADLANAMLAMKEQISPIIDAADGMKADLESRGWSPTAAEQVGLQFLLSAMSMVWGHMR